MRGFQPENTPKAFGGRALQHSPGPQDSRGRVGTREGELEKAEEGTEEGGDKK